MSLVSVEGYSNLKKDTSSGGVVNVDTSAYKNYMTAKAFAKRNVDRQEATQEAVVELQQQINTINTDLQDIRLMLMQLIQKGN